MHAVQWPPGGTLLIGTVRARSGELDQGKACFSTWGVTTETLVCCQHALTQHYERLSSPALQVWSLEIPCLQQNSLPRTDVNNEQWKTELQLAQSFLNYHLYPLPIQSIVILFVFCLSGIANQHCQGTWLVVAIGLLENLLWKSVGLPKFSSQKSLAVNSLCFARPQFYMVGIKKVYKNYI